MSAFATLYAYNLYSGNQFRIGLTNDQYQMFSAIFPYFEDNAKDYVIEAMHCSDACSKLHWQNVPMPKIKLNRDEWTELVSMYTHQPLYR